MHISFSPQIHQHTLTLLKQGDILTINGEEFDFTSLPDGGTLPAEKSPSPWIIGAVHRIDGELHLTLTLPYKSADAPEAVRFPQPITVTEDGPIPLPGGEDVAS